MHSYYSLNSYVWYRHIKQSDGTSADVDFLTIKQSKVSD